MSPTDLFFVSMSQKNLCPSGNTNINSVLTSAGAFCILKGFFFNGRIKNRINTGMSMTKMQLSETMCQDVQEEAILFSIANTEQSCYQSERLNVKLEHRAYISPITCAPSFLTDAEQLKS